MQKYLKGSSSLLVVLIVLLIILPLPAWLLDMMFILNLSISFIILLISMNIHDALQFSLFPSILLITTLFRLALNISSTRLILIENGYAGEVVKTFGDCVIRGNPFVGLVIFLIIVVVQFIVISKGSERVAEVSARFTLDAMPGKQMSIDSDMRAGVITLAEARHRRENLTLESRLFGSMDGAMKFVKGDAIAGLIIILVNIIGGLSIGTLQNGMAMSDALQLYAILTIGDGLVAQIPALFIAITSGIIVSRVKVDDDSNLGSDIGKQLLGQPSALISAAGIVAAMGLVPGFPTTVFLFLGILLAITGFALRKAQNRMEFAASEVTTVMGQEVANTDSSAVPDKNTLEDMHPLSPVLVELPTQARALFSPEILSQRFTLLRREFYLDLGVPIPGISLRIVNSLAADAYRISIRGVPVAQGVLKTQRGTTSNTELPSETAAATGAELTTSNLANARETPDNLQSIHNHLAYLLRKHAAEFIGIQEIHTLYAKLEQAGYLELVREAQRATNSTKTADVLRRLLNEGVSVRDLRQILETLVEFGEAEKDTGMLTERVRISLKRQISYSFTNGTGVLPVYMFAPETEKLLQNNLRQTPTGVFFALPPEVAQQFTNTLQELEAQHSSNTVRPVILTGLELRRHVRRHLESTFGHIPVLSVQELTSTISLNPMGEIRLT